METADKAKKESPVRSYRVKQVTKRYTMGLLRAAGVVGWGGMRLLQSTFSQGVNIILINLLITNKTFKNTRSQSTISTIIYEEEEVTTQECMN